MKKKKLLYLMHVPWGWIKQRPHFLAEKISKDFDLQVYYKKPLTVRENSLKEERTDYINIDSYTIIPFTRLPILNNFSWLRFINTFLLKIKIKRFSEYEFIWITTPNQYEFIQPLLKPYQKVIYDCMDDMVSFPSVSSDIKYRKHMEKSEVALIQRADLCIFSADYLRQTVLSRYGLTTSAKKSIVVNNAIEIPTESCLSLPEEIQKKLDDLKSLSNIFLYVGTIEQWLDMELLLYSLKQNPTMNIVLIGPCKIDLPNHPRLHYYGTIKREFIFNFMEASKALLMPFIVNDLIKSVNPVKLYEYVWMNKAILAPAYSESEKFDPYVYLYKDKESYSILCREIIEGKLHQKVPIDKSRDFINNNTWDKRYESIKTQLSLL